MNLLMLSLMKLTPPLNETYSIGIRNSMKQRDKVYKKWIKAKNPDTKNEYQIQYKTLRILILKMKIKYV